MSIEAMKRIKSLLQDTKMIDSHTISAVVAECDMAILAQQPATQPADVTDEQIAACVKRASTYGLPFVGLLNPGGAPSEFSKRFTAEILALRPVQVPMTADQIASGYTEQGASSVLSFLKGVRFAEAHHDIKPKEQAWAQN